MTRTKGISFIRSSPTYHFFHPLGICLLCLILSYAACGSGKSDSIRSGEPKRSYFGSCVSDAGYLYSAPARWRGRDWLKLGAFTVLGAGIYTLDDDIQEWSQSNQNKTSRDFSRFAEKLGNTSSTSIALGASFLAGLAIKDERMQQASLLAIKSSLLSGLMVQTLKNVFHRHRPNANTGKNMWEGPAIGGQHLAFPSGHTTTAFAIATVFATTYKHKKWVPTSAYSLAVIAGLSRIHDNKHWATDVFAGALLGYFSAKAILKNDRRNNRSIVLYPLISTDSYQIAIHIGRLR